MEGRLDRPNEVPPRLGFPGAVSGRFGRTPRSRPLPIASIAPNLSARARQEGGLRPVKFLLAVQDVEEADKGPKDFFAEAATARQRVGADDSEQAGEAGPNRTALMIPIRLKPRPTSMRRPTFGRPPAARTRPTSILAFGSGSRAFRLQRRTSNPDPPISSPSASSPVTYVPTTTQICRPSFTLEARGDILADPHYGAGSEAIGTIGTNVRG